MYASVVFAGAALLHAASAVPAAAPAVTAAPDANVLVQRDGKAIDGLSPWVEVDGEAQPVRTVTPSMTTISGTQSVMDAAPYMLTGSVFSWTSYAEIFTSTGLPPNPTATAKGGRGEFSRCTNVDGENAPFCRPSTNTTLLTGNTYYVTWDPDFYPKPKGNTSYEVAVKVQYYNHTEETWNDLETFNRVPAAWGFWPWKLETKHLHNDHDHAYTNISLTLLSSLQGSDDKNSSDPLFFGIAKPGLLAPERSSVPTDQTLIIALPAALGSLFILAFGFCLWNRKTRRIGLGNVMSRSRHAGYTGNRARRTFRRKKDQGIQLDTRAPEPQYRDFAPPDMPRRDSDALDSLAGSPTTGTFNQQGIVGGRNAFRDEMQRQDWERRGDARY